jgi:predicted CxxxxCH...CXXCH cytochrome family protein
VEPTVSARCAGCHGGSSPAGGYDLTDYLGAIDRGALSRLGAVLDPDRADQAHRGLGDVLPVLERWASGECELAFSSATVHGPGILDPLNARDFHGAILAAAAWDMSPCTQCHGADFRGGTSRVACDTCHPGGPTSCTTCHGAPPASGAHLAHAVGADLGLPVPCDECHRVPQAWNDPGHLDVGPPADVTFGPLARTDATSPTYARATGTCAGVYCHGATLDDRATHPEPTWTGGATQAACGACHGVPPADGTHSANLDLSDCVRCHPRTVDASGSIVVVGGQSTHVNGRADVGL